ncbi:Abhydrolase domain-containing protein mpaH [Mycena venus]|uniref:Abhydrolase domain-containing protein mpaH n=1 Tax=Mycena venus TaxID=2733690 RepID=A0A8H7CEZ8_9AGAR|nr:Abhydrolase domain-containing protein mpaH [Mycena venus]
MLEESVTYAPSARYPLYLTAKRYWLPAFEANAGDPAALTLLFLHATSFHKETWMPTLDAIFALASSEDSPVKIREAWCLDCPNHGASGQMNATVLLQPEFFLNFSCERFAQAVHHFLSIGPDQGGSVDFRKRNLVGIGHSLGGCAITMLQAIEPVFPFSSIVLIEPLLSPAGSHHLRRLRELLVKGAYERRDVWPDRHQAMLLLQRRDRTKKWDPRILKIFVEYGILEHPGARYPEGAYPGVTLACTRDQEAAMYRDPDGATKPVETLKRLFRAYPVHLILGGEADFVPARVHKAIIDAGPYASVATIENAGHLIVQEVPDRLGKAIYDALAQNARLRSKL